MVLWGSEAEMTVEWPSGMLGRILVERGRLDEAEVVLARGERGGGVSDSVSFWRGA